MSLTHAFFGLNFLTILLGTFRSFFLKLLNKIFQVYAVERRVKLVLIPPTQSNSINKQSTLIEELKNDIEYMMLN